MRDVAADFGYQPPATAKIEIVTSSIVGNPGPYLAVNSFDSGPYGAALTELTALDTILTVGGQNFFVEQGAGRGMKLVVDWTTAPVGSGTIQTQLITSTGADNASLSVGLVMVDFGALPVLMFFQGYRQVMVLPRSAFWRRFLSLKVTTTGVMTAGAYVSWLGLDVDSAAQGYADGFSLK